MRSCITLTLDCCCFVISFTTWNAFLLLFLFRQSSISVHCSSIQSSLAFFLPCLIFLLISLYSVALVVYLACFILLHLSHIFKISSVIHGWVFRWCFPSSSLAASVIILLKVVVITSASSSSASSGVNFPSIITWNVSQMEWSFSLSRLNFILVFVGFLIFLSLTLKFMRTRSWSLPMGTSLSLLYWCLTEIDVAPECSLSGCDRVHLVHAMPSAVKPCVHPEYWLESSWCSWQIPVGATLASWWCHYKRGHRTSSSLLENQCQPLCSSLLEWLVCLSCPFCQWLLGAVCRNPPLSHHHSQKSEQRLVQ